MQQAFRQTATVQADGVVQVCAPESLAGATVEVIILVEEQAANTAHLSDFIGAAKGSFATPVEADAFIRRERDVRL